MTKCLFPKVTEGPFHLFFPPLCSTVCIWHDLDTQSYTFPDTKGALNIEHVLVPTLWLPVTYPSFQCHFFYHMTVYFSLNNLSKWYGSLWFTVEVVGQAMAGEVPLVPMATLSPGRSHPHCNLTVDLTSQAVLYISISICWINTYILLQTNICRAIDQLRS